MARLGLCYTGINTGKGNHPAATQGEKPMTATVAEPTNSTEAKAAAAAEREAARVAKAEEKEAARVAKAAEREAAKAAKAAEPKRQCLCGCGGDVKGKSNFLPGHDARLVGMVARGEADDARLTGYPLLQAKAEKMKANLNAKVHNAEQRKAAKAERDAEKAIADKAKADQRELDKASKAAAKAEAAAAKTAAREAEAVVGTGDADVEVKIGREWIPGHRIADDGKGNIVVKHKDGNGKWTESVAKKANVRDIETL